MFVLYSPLCAVSKSKRFPAVAFFACAGKVVVLYLASKVRQRFQIIKKMF